MKEWVRFLPVITAIAIQMLLLCQCKNSQNELQNASSQTSAIQQEQVISSPNIESSAAKGSKRKLVPGDKSNLVFSNNNVTDNLLSGKETVLKRKKKFARADRNSKRLILENYSSSELLANTASSKSGLFKFRDTGTSSKSYHRNEKPKLYDENSVTIASYNQKQSDSIHNLHSIAGIENPFRRKEIKDPSTDKQNLVNYNLYMDQQKYKAQNDQLENFITSDVEDINLNSKAASANSNTGTGTKNPLNQKKFINPDMPSEKSQLISKEVPIKIKYGSNNEPSKLKNIKSNTGNQYIINRSIGDINEELQLSSETDSIGDINEELQLSSETDTATSSSMSDEESFRFENEEFIQSKTTESHEYELGSKSEGLQEYKGQQISQDNIQITDRLLQNSELNSNKKSITQQNDKIYPNRRISKWTQEDMHDEKTDIYNNNFINALNDKQSSQKYSLVDKNTIFAPRQVSEITDNNNGRPAKFKTSEKMSSVNANTNFKNVDQLLQNNLLLDEELEIEGNSLQQKNIHPRKVAQDLSPSIEKKISLGKPTIAPGLVPMKTELTEAERSKRLTRALERLIQFVNIVGQVDSYLTDKARNALRKLSLLYDADGDPGYRRRRHN